MPETNFDFSVLETIPDTDAEIEVPEEVLEGPQTEEEQGVASLILDAISNSANTIQMYNAIIANCTDEEIIDSLNEILVDENRIMGKLQSILQKVSPNAEEIMNGAIEDSGLDESFTGVTNLNGLTNIIVDILNNSDELEDCDINSIGKSFRITVNGIRYEYTPTNLSKVDESLNESKVMSGNQFANWYNYHDGKYNRPKLDKIYAVIDNSTSSGVDDAEDLFSQYDCLSQEEKQQITDIINESLNEDVFKNWKPNTSFKHIKSVLDTALARGKYINNERDEVFAALDKADKGGYTPEQRKFIKDKHREMWKKNRTVESFILDESMKKPIKEEAKKITRYSDVLPQKDRDRGWWYFTTHGVGPGTIPKDLNVLEIRDGQNNKGTWGTFVRLDGIVNTSELSYYDLTELAPPNVKNESLNESIAIKKNSTWIDTVGNDLCKVVDIKEVEKEKRNISGSFKDTDIIVQYDDSPRKFTFSKGEFLVRFVPFRKSYHESINNESLSEYARENIDQFIRNYLEHHPFDSAEEMIDYLEEYGEIEELEDRFHTDVEAAIEDYFEYLNESLILDESNNLDTSLDDITPVRDEHNERAIRDHKKYKEDRKKAFKEISKNAKNAFELDESLFESFYLNYEDSDLLQDWDQGGLDFSVDIHPYKYEFYTSRDANKALKIAISHGYKDSWREGRYVYLTAH